MPPTLALCLCFFGTLFSGTLVGLSYAQLKLPRLEDDGYFKLQRDLAGQVGMGEWAKLQRSRPVRWASFIISITLLSLSVFGIAWFAVLTFFPT